MPQAAKPITPHAIGFIGAGRLAQTLAWRLHAVGYRVHAVASRSHTSATALAAPIAPCAPCSAQTVADTCELVFITTPDAAIQTTAQSITWRKGQGVVHCSGATDVAVLEKAQNDGALIGGLHPLQSFADPVSAAQTLAGCTMTIQAREPLRTVLTTLAQRLECAVHVLPEEARAAYHAAASFASQHINVLLAQAVRIWQSWGASEDAALRALLPLAKGLIASIETAGLAQGMPGPVSRADVTTVQKHLAALRDRDASVAALYCDLCARSVPLALAAGKLNADQTRQMEHILRQFAIDTKNG